MLFTVACISFCFVVAVFCLFAHFFFFVFINGASHCTGLALAHCVVQDDF